MIRKSYERGHVLVKFSLLYWFHYNGNFQRWQMDIALILRVNDYKYFVFLYLFLSVIKIKTIFITTGIKESLNLKAMASKECLEHGIVNFDDDDFSFWRIQIEDYLYRKKQHLLLARKKTRKDFRR